MKTKYIKSKVAFRPKWYPKAEWIDIDLWTFNPVAKCSRCKIKGIVRTKPVIDNDHKCFTFDIDMPYCPACGAFMKNGCN